MSILQQSEVNNRNDTNNYVTEESPRKKEQEIAEKEEENSQIKKKVETYQLKLKTSMANEISSATEVIRLQALMSTTLQTIETDKFKASDKAIQLVKLNADEVQRLTVELANERESKAALQLQLTRNTAEIKQLNDEKIKATTSFNGILFEKKSLEMNRAQLLSTISTMNKEAASSECETIKDLRVQLSINKLSQNNLLLDEIQVLESEIERLHDVEVVGLKASSALKDSQKELLDLKKAKNVLWNELGSTQNTVTILKEQIKILSDQKVKQKEVVSSHNSYSQNNGENHAHGHHQTQSDDSKLNGCTNRNHRIDELLSTFEDDNLNEFEIEKLILEAKEDVLRVKEKRTEFQQYKQSKRFSLAAGNDMDKEKEKEMSRRKDNGSPLLDSNILIGTDTIQCKHNILPLQGANQSSNQGSNHNIKAPSFNPDLDPSRDLNQNSSSTDSTYFHFTTHSTTSATSTAASTSTSATASATNGHIIAADGRLNTEKSIFEKRMCSLLKSLGINEHIYTNFLSHNNQSDEKWNDIVRMLSDNERKKIMIVRGCLIRFCSKLTPSEIDELEDIGIVLGPRSSPRKMGLNLGSALCFA